MDWRSRISVDPQVVHGQACVKGTRIPVTVILDNLADGGTTADVLGEYPTLQDAADVAAALAYAAELARERVLRTPA